MTLLQEDARYCTGEERKACTLAKEKLRCACVTCIRYLVEPHIRLSFLWHRYRNRNWPMLSGE